MSRGAHTQLGRWGEEQVAGYLRQRGWNIVAANYRTRFGEIDLIAENAHFLVFVEVKLRSGRGPVRGVEAVDRHKQQRLRTTAEWYLSLYPTEKQPRFDVAEVIAPDGTHTAAPEIRYLENVF
ncbi:MAG TPA: YraN family protein [Candidatus Flavonifractor merdigallinarum]|uniref:UPF0102 protein H9841_10935 n=1 Tax=Candidatus Flavonifractor merdigallinarum TaxID=2838589 RepID=A0A9D2C010_9FIRM|nr:YraN family protein [Candidatus Flavonifractor merdigallinarum]